MAKSKVFPRLVEDATEDQRNALEESLLSLLQGFSLRHSVSDKVLCSILQDVTDWLSCPRNSRRVFLRSSFPDGHNQADEREVS